MSAKRDGATVSVSKEDVAWELVKMVCAERQKCYIAQEGRLRDMVDAYRLTIREWDQSAARLDSLPPKRD